MNEPLIKAVKFSRALRIERARKELLAFTVLTKPDYQVSWHHRKLSAKLDAFARGDIKFLMVFMPPRHGKLCSVDTPIMTPNGLTTHGNIKKGDYVFHPSGKPIKVLAKSSPIKSNAKIYFSDSSIIECHLNHEWTVFDRSYGREFTYETHHFLKKTKFGKKMNCFSGGRSKYQLPEISALEFKEAVLPMHPYVLGAWLGDGTSKAPRITHAPSDNAVISKIVSLGFKVSSITVHPKSGCLTTAFAGTRNNAGPMSASLKNLDLIKNKHIPQKYKLSSIEQRLELIAGLIDTDGHVEPKTGRVRIVTVSKKLADDISDVATTLGWHPYVTIQEPSLSSSGIQGRKSVYTVGFQPDREIPVALDRKKIKRFAKRRRIGIVKVEETTDGKLGHCIQVDSPDGLYLVGEKLIPTHNSELVSRRLPAFLHGLYPDCEIMAASYLDTLASDMTIDVQNIIDSPLYKEVFPETSIYPPGTSYTKGTRNSSEHHIIGRRGKYRGQGVGGSFTGKGANFIIIDDPIKGREIADSVAFRERLWNFYNNDLFSRLETNLETGRQGQILITQTRWHEDDLSGRLLELMAKDKNSIQWEILSYPAIRCDMDTESDTRKIGEPLWPEKYNIDQLNQIKASIGPRAWGSLYQQSPVPDGGGLFKDEMFGFCDVSIKDVSYSFIMADTAYKEKQENDFTVFTLFGVKEEQLFVVDVLRAQIKASDIESAFEPFVRKYCRTYGYRGTYIEPKGHGIYLNQAWAKKGLMIPGDTDIEEFYKDRRFDKVERANNVVPHLANRKVYFNNLIGNKEDLVAECLTFPKGKHDDFLDTLVDGLKMAYGRSISMFDVY
jgi:predicted phage terminase large subunit-like protein